jgi:DNA-binding beta-propeller fold protein YncE
VRLEDELRRALREEVSRVGSSEEAWRSIERRLGQGTPEHRGSRVATIALALTLSAASLSGLWWGFRSGPVDRAGREVTPEPVDLQPRVSAVVAVGPYPVDVAVGEGAVWVSVPAQEPRQDNLLVRVDSVTNQVVARIPVENYIEELAAGAGGIWGLGVRGSGPDLSFYVDRIDPATNEVVARIPDVSGPLAVGDGVLWAVDHAGARAGPDGSSLLRIDPATNEVVARIALGVAIWDIEVGEGYVWVLPLEPDPGEGDILQVDPATNQVVARIEIPLPGTVYAPALGEESAWVPVCCVDDGLMLVRVDVGTSQIVGEPTKLPIGAPFAVAAGHVWLVEERGALYGLNVATLEVDETVSGLDWPAGGFPDPSTELDPGQLAVWVVNPDQDSVTRVDLASPTGGGGSSLEAEGTSLLLPEGWEGRADPLPGYTHRIFQAATFPLPPLVDIEATDARSRIGPRDVLIVLEEFTALCPSCPSESSGLPVVLGQQDFEDRTGVPKWLPPLTDVPLDHSLARRIFNVGFRYFDLRVEFGDAPVTDDTLERVNDALASLTIGEWVPDPNGICQWREIGIMRDPDCPQPRWLRQVLTVAGFRIDEEGGSGAWVARSGDAEFFIWVDEEDEVSEERLALLQDPEAFPIRETVQGVTVYGNSRGWDWSTDKMHVYVQQGPDGDSKLPNLEELIPIVEVSLDVPYPPGAV